MLLGNFTVQPTEDKILTFKLDKLFTGLTVTSFTATATCSPPGGLTFRGPTYITTPGSEVVQWIVTGVTAGAYKVTNDTAYTVNGEVLHAPDEVTVVCEEI